MFLVLRVILLANSHRRPPTNDRGPPLPILYHLRAHVLLRRSLIYYVVIILVTMTINVTRKSGIYSTKYP